MGCCVIVGGAYGDEGKGKIISYLALKDKPSIAARGGVGPNAGHTIEYNGKTLKLRMLPSAVVNESTRLLIGAGVLVDPVVFFREVEQLGCQARAKVDRNCAIIESKHITLDKEGHLKDTIGTTGTGTGPANSDRVMRVGRIAAQEESLSNYLEDVALSLNSALDRGETVLVEGTQGTLLSLYHGDYPYVTSKDVSASGICSDVGIGPKRVDDVLVVFKSYLTRVGGGTLEGELPAEQTLSRGWQEYGSVTGRLRRAAPFNFKLARRSVVLNSATQIAITKLDSIFPDMGHKRAFTNLSSEAREFVKKVEDELATPVVYIGTGPDAEDIIDRRNEVKNGKR
ncbi:MAG: adenylosuccinate synthetase [Thaumarchaeota archaeon]|nr:adenylosuccinate synthetase [Nitrososphaerota archaeon]